MNFRRGRVREEPAVAREHRLDHHHLADILGREQPDEAVLSVHHRQHRAV